MQKPCFASKVEVLPASQSKRPRATDLHLRIAVVGVGANVGSARINILCAWTVHFCYYVRTLIANVFFAFAAKLHFICTLSLVPVSARWLQGLLLSTDRAAMRIQCVQIAYYAKIIKNTNIESINGNKTNIPRCIYGHKKIIFLLILVQHFIYFHSPLH